MGRWRGRRWGNWGHRAVESKLKGGVAWEVRKGLYPLCINVEKFIWMHMENGFKTSRLRKQAPKGPHMLLRRKVTDERARERSSAESWTRPCARSWRLGDGQYIVLVLSELTSYPAS